MQLLLSKKISHSEAIGNLDEGMPVKERENPLQIQSTTSVNFQHIESTVHNAKLDLEIEIYWALSKCHQFLHRKHVY